MRGVMKWPLQLPDLNPTEMVRDELDHRVKENEPTSAQQMWELLQHCWKTVGHCVWSTANTAYFEESKVWNIFALFNTFFFAYYTI